MLTLVLAVLMVGMKASPSFATPFTIRPRQGNITFSPGTSSVGHSIDLESASSCIWSKLDWANDGGSQYASQTVFITSDVRTREIDLATYETVVSLTNSTPYSLCDGWPRMHGTTSIVKHSSLSTETWTSCYISTSDVWTSYPAPNCTILKSDCDFLYSSWSSEESAYNATISSYSSYIASASAASIVPDQQRPVRRFISPICGSPTPHTPQKTSSAQCAVAGATVQLLYWPVTRIPAQSCQGSASTVTLEPTLPGKPNTAEYWGTTLTSPTVYMALQGTWQLVTSGTTYRDRSQILLPQEPSAVSSLCGTLGDGSHAPYPFDYADLNGDTPASAYRCQPRCYTHSYAPSWIPDSSVESGFTLGNTTVPATARTYLWDNFTGDATENLCSTIWDDYRPQLSIPPEWSSLKPATQAGYQGCAFLLNPDAFFDDPPKALVERPAIVEPSDPASTTADVPGTTKTPPGPGSTPNPQTPEATQISNSNLDPPTQTARQSEVLSVSSKAPIPKDPSNAPQLTEHSDEPDALPGPSSPAPTQIITKVSPTITGLVITGTNGQTLTAIQAFPAAPVIIGSATLTIGQSTSFDGLGEVFVQASGLLVDGSVSPFSALERETAIGAVMTDSEGRIIVAEQLSLDGAVGVGGFVLKPGQSTTIAGAGAIEIAANGLLMVNGGHVTFSTINLAIATSQPFFTIGGATFVAYATSAAVLAPGLTLSPGGSVVSFSGHIVSLAPSGLFVVVDGTTQLAAAPGLVFTMDGQTYTVDKASAFAFKGTTLTPGGIAVVNGKTISLDGSRGYVVVDGFTRSFAGQSTSLHNSGGSFSHTLSDGRESATGTPEHPATFVSSASSDLRGCVLVSLLSALVCYGFSVHM